MLIIKQFFINLPSGILVCTEKEYRHLSCGNNSKLALLPKYNAVHYSLPALWC